MNRAFSPPSVDLPLPRPMAWAGITARLWRLGSNNHAERKSGNPLSQNREMGARLLVMMNKTE